MSKLLIIGGSKGIGAAIVQNEAANREIVNLSRTVPADSQIEHHTIDIVSDELPELENISHLIYCPGSINLKPINSLKLDDFRADFEINVIGAVKAIKQYSRQMKKQEQASITLFSTVAVTQGMPFHASVAAAKAAIEGLTKSLAAEFAPKIRVNCIAPTITQTDLASGILRNEEAVKRMEDRHPLKRILQAEEVAALASYLISDAAKSITGQVFNIDAGMSTLRT